jgi:hypothetical protein
MFSKLTLIIVCCLIFSSCSSKNELEINFSSDSTTILFTGLDEVSLFRAKQQTDSLAQELVSVFESGENSGVEKQVAGKIEIKKDTLIFKPKKSFVKDNEYLVQTVLNSSFGKTEDILKADIGKTVKRQEKVLVR